MKRKGDGRRLKKNKQPVVIDANAAKDAALVPMAMGGSLAHAKNPMSADRIAEDAGGRHEFINICRLSDAPEAIEFVRKCMIEGDDVSLQTILESQGLRMDKLMEVVVPALVRAGGNIGRLINALGVPQVMKDSIRNASLPGMEGFADRKLQLDIAGLTPKTGNINVIGQMNVGGIERPEHTLKQVSEVIDVLPDEDE